MGPRHHDGQLKTQSSFEGSLVIGEFSMPVIPHFEVDLYFTRVKSEK